MDLAARRATYDAVMTQLAEDTPELHEMVQGLVEEMTVRLGESPEAWRGVQEVCDMIVASFKAAESAHHSMDPRRASGMVTFVTAVCVTFSLHPLTPWGRGVDR